MLRVSVLGNLGADAEMRYSQKGTPMTSFRVAVRQLRTTPEGERQESTEWFRVRAMGRLGEYAQRLQKGTRVLVEGRLEISHYQSREGEPRTGFDVWADEVINLSTARGMSGDDDETAEPAAQVSAPVTSAAPRAAAPSERAAAPARRATAVAEPESVDDLPF